MQSQQGNSRALVMKTIVKIGEVLYVDVIDIAKGFREDENEHISCSQDKYYMGYGFNWPYFSYGTKLNVVVVLNAFNPSFQQRYEMPENVNAIVQTFLTDSHDLFIATESICPEKLDDEQYFEIYHLNLD